MSQTIFYNSQCETIPRDGLEQLQIERLQSTLNRVYRNVVFYQAAFDSHRVNLQKLKSLQALRDIPFTTRQDLQKSYPYNMFAVPLRDIVRIHSTAGTAEKPIVVGYTRNDLRNWTECVARLLTAAGITEHDVVQIALDYNIFAGGFGFHQGAEQIGATVIPASLTTSVEKQIMIMKDYKTTVLITTPSHAVNIAAGIEDMHVHPDQLQLKLALFDGEPLGDQLRRELEQQLHIALTDTYGLTEVMGPGVAGECHARQGLHINEDHFIVEIINPKTLQPVKIGDEGELVFTTITKEGFPLIRYRTGDITSLNPQPCACGRTFLRMAKVTGRTDDLISFRGVGFFPSQIEEILTETVGQNPQYQIILDRAGGVDTLEIRLEVSGKFPSIDGIRALETFLEQLAKRIRTVLDVEAKVTFVEPKSLQVAEGKGRVLDKRPGY
ncbi:MAG: phenylacetate--CoA ligase [Planctomycetes bacterium]|nr:phenylacetate--CoA ligase [Planctomycetota bacterium]